MPNPIPFNDDSCACPVCGLKIYPAFSLNIMTGETNLVFVLANAEFAAWDECKCKAEDISKDEYRKVAHDYLVGKGMLPKDQDKVRSLHARLN